MSAPGSESGILVAIPGMEQILLQWEPERRTFTVGELNAAIRELLDAEFSDIWVSGEISGVKQAASGHWYFNLKDAQGTIRCVCFRNAARLLKFKPQDGVAVLARGRIDVYEARGEYQLMVESLEPQGHGALQFAFEQLKKKLAEEGLFDAERKRPLPLFPRRIGIVTSPTGAVIRDILHVLQRRHPGLHIRLYPAQVQGEGSVEQVCRGLHYFHVSQWADVVILARGGGSLEDLWTFNDEEVARAVARCATPVISAIGHETDFTITDFVADLRAPTPSAAAELVIQPKEAFRELLSGFERSLEQAMRLRLSDAHRSLRDRGIERATTTLHRNINRQLQRVDDSEARLKDLMRKQLKLHARVLQAFDGRLQRRDLRLQVADGKHRLSCAENELHFRIKAAIHDRRCLWQPLEAKLSQLSPLAVLQRGYAMVETSDGKVVKSPVDAPAGTRLQIRLAEGTVNAEAKE